jgi:hypothetical protein
MRIRCKTLFDITRTNVILSRNLPANTINTEVIKQRNQQSNYNTILQIISLRSQPENITEPKTIKERASEWGSEYTKNNKTVTVWTFTFTVHHSGVFHDGISELGNLLSDSDNVPMMIHLDEDVALVPYISNKQLLTNIKFQVENDE